MSSAAPETWRVPGERLLALAAEALGALLPEGAGRCAWLFAGPPVGGGDEKALPSSSPAAVPSSVSAGPSSGLGQEQGLAPEMAAGHPAGWLAGSVADWHGQMPADQRLALWLRRHPSLGVRERRWLSDRIYDVLRHGRAYEVFLQQRPGGLVPEDRLEPPSRAQAQAQAQAQVEVHSAAQPPVDREPEVSGLPALSVRLRRLVLLSEACRLQAALAAGAASVPGSADQGQREGVAGLDAVTGVDTGPNPNLGPAPPIRSMAAGRVAAAFSVQPGAEALCGLAQVYLDWLRGQPPAVRYSLPDWLWAGLCQTHGEVEAAQLGAVLLRPAAIEIRVNLLKGKPAVLQGKLAEEGITASAVADVPNALRLAGRPALARSPRFAEGWFELQDAGSQRIVETCAARRGERVIDFCAGAGGKTLALAARMRNQGQILAFDTEAARLDKLGPRLARAGVSIVTSLRLDGSEDARLARYQRWADLVLVDAPCSGSGTFRRHPDLKWRLRPGDVSRYQAVQREILQAAVRLLRPGGRLVYATCSLLGQENQQQTAWFAQWLAGQGGNPARLAEASSRYWLPDGEGGDAFFMSEWRSPR